MLDYEYCGECKHVKSLDVCPLCCYFCEVEFNHPSGHGTYCKDCGQQKRPPVFIELDNNKFFCNKKCYEKYKIKNKNQIIK